MAEEGEMKKVIEITKYTLMLSGVLVVVGLLTTLIESI